MDVRPFRAFCALILLPLLSGCAYLDTGTSHLLNIPEPPIAWSAAFGPMSHLVVWIDEDGRPAECRLGPGQDSLALRTGKGGWNPVAAFALPPCFEAEASAAIWGGVDGLSLYPAGAVSPGGGESVQLSYQAGAAAFILLRLAGRGVPIKAINVPRLLRELSERTGGNPWRADIEGLVLRFAARDFRADLIRVRDEITVALPGDPGTGSLVSRDPLRPHAKVVVDKDGAAAVTAPPAALSRFYSLDGAVRLDLWIPPEGGAQWVVAPGRPR